MVEEDTRAVFMLTTAVGMMVISMLLPAAAHASSIANNGPLTTGTTVHMILMLAVVIGFIVCAAWLVKRLNYGFSNNSAAMKVVASLSLGAKERIMVVDVAGHQLLLAVCQGQIRLLHTFGEPIFAKDNSSLATMQPFSQRFKEVLSRAN